MKTNRHTYPGSKNAFTLIELLVLIGILCLLASFMLPALARAKIKSPATGCLSNLRQMQLGWSMYKDDNNDVMMPNPPVGSIIGWCPSGLMNWFTSSANTNTSNYTNSLLWPYVAGDITVYRCPGDVKPSQNGIRTRSCAMNGQMGAIYSQPGPANYDIPALMYIKGADLTCPTPANAFIFCDESMYTLNGGYFQIESHNGTFPSEPAAYHGGACGLGFADGHSEMHRWQTTAVTSVPYTYGVTGSSGFPVVGGKINLDWRWFSQHAACDP